MQDVTQYNYQMSRANPLTIVFSNLAVQGVAINTTSATMRFVAKWRPQDADASAVIVKATGGSGITTTATTVTVQLLKADTDIAAIPYQQTRLQYELIWLNPTPGQNQVVAFGDLVVRPNINRT